MSIERKHHLTEEIEVRGPVYYHATDSVIVKPYYEIGVGIQSRENRHPNGNLGLWFSFSPSWLAPFGSNLYTFGLTIEESEVFKLPLTDLVNWSKDADTDYKALRQRLLGEGYKIAYLVEINSKTDMGVVLDFSCIKDWELISKTDVGRKVCWEGLRT